MTLLDATLLPVVMICWLFISYCCKQRNNEEHWRPGGAYIMHLFNAL